MTMIQAFPSGGSGSGTGGSEVYSTTATLSTIIDDVTTVVAADLPSVDFSKLIEDVTLITDADGTVGLVTTITGTTSIDVKTITISGTTTYDIHDGGSELMVGQYSFNGSLANGSTETKLTLTTVSGKPANFPLSSGEITIPEGKTVKVTVTTYTSGTATASLPDYTLKIYDTKHSNTQVLYIANSYNEASGHSRPGCWVTTYEIPSGGSSLALYKTYANATRTVSVTVLIEEVSRIVDPVKYVSNNSDLQETPVGNVITYLGHTPPKHHLACDGYVYDIGTYPELEAWIINEYGSVNYFGGDGTNNWAVPDMRGEFLRGTGTNSHANQGNGANVGVHQDATGVPYFQLENYTTPKASFLALDSNHQTSYITNADKILKGDTTRIDLTGSSSTTPEPYNYQLFASRPTNTSVNWCIKYESTYHAFFSNAAYKVSVNTTVTSTDNSQLTFDSSSIIGDSSMVVGNTLVSPMDGWYLLSTSLSTNGTQQQYYYVSLNDTNIAYNCGIGISTAMYLSKGDILKIFKQTGAAQTGSVSLCLLESNYNPTIVGADSLYSTSEMQIGYWTDGKPLYQKTVAITTPSTANTNTQVYSDIDTTVRIQEVFGGFSYGNDRTNFNGRPLNYKCNDTDYSAIYAGGYGYVLVMSVADVNKSKQGYATIRYTKTTDTSQTSNIEVSNALLLNRPDLWTVGTEYNFGGGLYGQRFTGNTLALSTPTTNDAWTSLQLGTASGVTKIINAGGDISTTNLSGNIPSSIIGTNGLETMTSVVRTANGNIRLQYGLHPNVSWHYETSNTYDCWVLYKK